MREPQPRQYEPTRSNMPTGLGLRMYSLALAEEHDRIADASPVLRDFDPLPFDPDDPRTAPSLCTGRRRWVDEETIEPGHPDALALGDLAAREAAELAGEIGGASRLSLARPFWLRTMMTDAEAKPIVARVEHVNARACDAQLGTRTIACAADLAGLLEYDCLAAEALLRSYESLVAAHASGAEAHSLTSRTGELYRFAFTRS